MALGRLVSRRDGWGTDTGWWPGAADWAFLPALGSSGQGAWQLRARAARMYRGQWVAPLGPCQVCWDLTASPWAPNGSTALQAQD